MPKKKKLNIQETLEWAVTEARTRYEDADKYSDKELDARNKLLRTVMSGAKDLHGLREVEDMRELDNEIEAKIEAMRKLVVEARSLGVPEEKLQ